MRRHQSGHFVVVVAATALVVGDTTPGVAAEPCVGGEGGGQAGKALIPATTTCSLTQASLGHAQLPAQLEPPAHSLMRVRV